MREERLSGRIRGFIHAPTEIMLMDALTKIGIFPQIMRHATTGTWDTSEALLKAKSGTIRIIDRPRQDFDEQDLVDLNM